MNKVGIASAASQPRNDVKKTLNWRDNPSAQALLDVIASIIANEYIEIAKKNKDVFGIASAASQPRNDGEGLKLK